MKMHEELKDLEQVAATLFQPNHTYGIYDGRLVHCSSQHKVFTTYDHYIRHYQDRIVEWPANRGEITGKHTIKNLLSYIDALVYKHAVVTNNRGDHLCLFCNCIVEPSRMQYAEHLDDCPIAWMELWKKTT